MSPADLPSGKSGGSPPTKADWRGAKTSARAGTSRRKGATWQERLDRPYERGRRWHRIKIASLATAFVGCLAVFIWLVLYRPVKTPFLALSVTDYALPAFPPNGWAKEDAERFAALNDAEVKRLVRDRGITDYTSVAYDSEPESPLQGFHELKQQLQHVKAGGPAKKAVILYVSMHGAVNERGQPCLVPPRANPVDSRTWVPLTDALAYLFPKDELNSLPPKKLLVLDCNRMDANWPMGLLHNSFADQLSAVLDEAGIPGLVILNSTSPGQSGWTSPEELHGSVFGYFVWKGLMGWADREGVGNQDGEVSLRELQNYVSEQVRRWVRDHRADAQVPMLVSRGNDDFGLVYALPAQQFAEIESRLRSAGPLANGDVEAAPRTASPGTTSDPRWEKVAALWRTHEQLAKKNAWQREPFRWEQFQRGLLRLEQLILAGSAYTDDAARTERDLDKLAARLAQDPLTAGLAAHSLPLATQFSGNANAEAEASRLRQDWANAAGKFEAPTGRKRDALVTSLAAWQWCTEHPEGERWPDKLFVALDEAFPRPQTRPTTSARGQSSLVEMQFLRMLQDGLDPRSRQANPDLVRRALLTRELAETAASPVDARVQYWIRRSLDEADQKRRQAEDLLFVGDAESMRQADQLFTEVAGADGKGGKYQAILDQARAIGRAFAARDRAFRETPCLAEWHFARLQAREDPSRPQQLRTLIHQTHALARQIDADLKRADGAASQDGESTAFLEKSRQSVEKLLADLEKDYFDRCRELLRESGQDRQILRELSLVLAVPLASGDLRNRLRTRFLELSEKLASVSAVPVVNTGKDGSTGDGKSVSDEAARWLSRLVLKTEKGKTWDEHPALTIASWNPVAEAPAEKAGEERTVRPGGEIRMLASEGGRLRDLLASLTRRVEESSKETEAKLRLEERAPPPGETQEGYSRADQVVRSCAAVMAALSSPLQEPARDAPAQLRGLDLHYLMLLQAHRALDDFWGPAPREKQGTPFFVTAAGGYLESARRLCPSAVRLSYEKSDLNDLLKRRSIAAETWVQPKVEDPRVLTTDAPTKVDLTANLAQDLPPGKVAVSLQSESGKQTLPVFAAMTEATSQGREGLDRVGLDVAENGWKRTYWVRSNDERLKSRNFEAVAWFRGHRKTAPFTITPFAAGLEIVYEPPKELKSTITVKGRLMTECYVIFILDYSASMLEKVSEFQQAEQFRYVLAREALTGFLDRLAKIPNNPYRVGVMLYGHRRCWVNDRLIREAGLPPKTRTAKWEYKNGWRLVAADADFLDPDKDVEMIWPSLWPPRANLGDQDVAQVRDALKSKLPTGVTPLYLSIQQAIEYLEKVPKSTSGLPVTRHIVAITDGVNYQQMLAGGQKTEAIDVRRALSKPENRDIQLDVVGFLLPEQGAGLEESLKEDAKKYGVSVADLASSYQELLQLARSAGGNFHSVMATSRMTERLEQSLRLSRYAVHRAGVTTEPVLRELNDPWPVQLTRSEVAQDDGAPFVAEVPSRQASARVALKGGEALELYLTDDEKRLVHRRYSVGLRDHKENLTDPTAASRRLFVAAHLPLMKGNRVEFNFSVQNQVAEGFSPRPLETWVEIRPILPGGDKGPLYLFYDPQFKPDTPVPVVQCAAPDWPENAEEAEVQFWCKFVETTPEETIAVDQAKQVTIQGVPLEINPQSDAEHGRYRVVVLERHSPGSDLNSFRVEMSPQPAMAVHQYIREAGIARHTFSYTSTADAATGSYSLRVTSRERATKDAVSVPLRVRIPRNPVGGG